jgi:hypothetical protein
MNAAQDWSTHAAHCVALVSRVDRGPILKSRTWTRVLCSTALVGTTLAAPATIEAQEPIRPARPAAAPATSVGVELFGGAGISWPAAKDSFEAVELSTNAVDFGGGARVTGLWQGLFAQVALSRWSDTGERAFVGSDGTSFPLGIPLEVSASYIDATIGVKSAVRNSTGRITYITYAGAGAGVVRFKESSPFAEAGDDLNTTKPSYHLIGGIEVPIASGIAVAFDGKYRYIPGLLGDDGVSAVLDENFLGGFQVAAGLRLGFGGRPHGVPSRPPTPPVPTPTDPVKTVPPQVLASAGMILQNAPVFLLPDASRTPLRSLPAGTSIRILDQKGDWYQIEFNDAQFGRRVGYVQSKYVRVR